MVAGGASRRSTARQQGKWFALSLDDSSPDSFTLEAWVKTTTTQGGAILGFANLSTGAPGNYDRMIYMANTGQIYFGAGANKTINSTLPYNNGAWHMVDATLSQGGMALYIDGTPVASNPAVTEAQVYDGYWRVGYDSLVPEAGDHTLE